MVKLLDLKSLEDNDSSTAFQRKLKSELNLNPQQDNLNIEEKSDKIYGAIRTAVDTCIPKLRRPNNVYISQETLRLADKKREAKNNRLISDDHNQKYRELCNQVKRSSRQDKENWLDNKCREIDESAQELKSRKTYMLIKDVNKEWQPKQRGINDKDGNILEKLEKIKERWTEYCTQLYEENDPQEELVKQMEAVWKL